MFLHEPSTWAWRSFKPSLKRCLEWKEDADEGSQKNRKDEHKPLLRASHVSALKAAQDLPCMAQQNRAGLNTIHECLGALCPKRCTKRRNMKRFCPEVNRTHQAQGKKEEATAGISSERVIYLPFPFSLKGGNKMNVQNFLKGERRAGIKWTFGFGRGQMWL